MFLLESGTPAKAVAERLGNKNEKMLQTTHSHVIESMSEQVASEFDRLGDRPKTISRNRPHFVPKMISGR